MGFHYRLNLLRESVKERISLADQTIADVLRADDTEAIGDDPWVAQLIERRGHLQSTLTDLERQIEGHSA